MYIKFGYERYLRSSGSLQHQTPTLHLFEIIVDALPIILDIACTNNNSTRKTILSITHNGDDD